MIGIELTATDWVKARPLLPEASILNAFSGAMPVVQAVWVLDTPLMSAKQWRWASDVKLALRDRLEGIAFHFIDECYIGEYTKASGSIYSLWQLSKLLDVTPRRYPKIYYPPDAKLLYRRLCWWAAKAVRKGVYTLEGVIATAMTVNAALARNQRLEEKQLLKKAAAVDKWVRDHPDRLKPLTGEQLRRAHQAGARKRNANQGRATRRRIKAAIASGNYTKPSGRPNIKALAEALGLSRRTIERHLKAMK